MLGFGDVTEGAFHIAAQIVHAQFADFHRNRAGFDLGQIENIVDQHQQIVTGRVDGLGKIHLFGGEIALRIHAQLIGKNQQAVQRGAQFMRHIGKELGFVFRSERKLPGLFFQRLPRLFHFLILAFHLLILVRQQTGFFLQLFVGLL